MDILDNTTTTAPRSAWMSAYLSEKLWEVANRPGIFDHIELPRMTWWNRLKWELDKWLPRVHCGPCDHEGCDA